MLRSPLQRLKNEHVECSLQQLNPVFVLVFLAHRCRHSTRLAVDCLLPHHGGTSIQSRAYATPQMRSESGLTFRSKQSAGLLTHAVGAEAASQQEKLAICPDSTSSGVERSNRRRTLNLSACL